ncbi:Putative F0F1-ATPase subunit Ca2+/Mg2+ transporter [Pseudarcicella hirudinis]|uniref:Putative F0F1-ATPase subunit Ca2+/Mg2+ transporter n=1 Tax=Pseudarcicella hirudinis TaxID=1079859 RepID=A0A1I5W1C1_9BACT|nr:AtpZ/AtpI family protein [Pseudarcicella hirudinis]SFQ13539.1 Putative F0F1-ATPase subunit Ca2+/Mg2+ transporter [Pseudarcicella hirudinis]
MENKNQEPDQNPYLKYMGAGTQMLVSIGAGVYLGLKLDEWFQTKTPWFTIACSMLFIFGSMYLFIKSLPKE